MKKAKRKQNKPKAKRFVLGKSKRQHHTTVASKNHFAIRMRKA